jgi:Cupin
MDVLSEVLKVVKLQGALYYHGEFSSPWSVCSPPSRMVVPHLAPGAGHVIICHMLTEGRASARLLDGERMTLNAGYIPGKGICSNCFPGVETDPPRRRRGSHQICLRLYGVRARSEPGFSQRAAAYVQSEYS